MANIMSESTLPMKIDYRTQVLGLDPAEGPDTEIWPDLD